MSTREKILDTLTSSTPKDGVLSAPIILPKQRGISPESVLSLPQQGWRSSAACSSVCSQRMTPPSHCQAINYPGWMTCKNGEDQPRSSGSIVLHTVNLPPFWRADAELRGRFLTSPQARL
ncbi:MAG: hypothetical protein IPP55_17000 [Anaerolineales bacterium]|nr:hypothetical protein [Anaerolineales bacterium]